MQRDGHPGDRLDGLNAPQRAAVEHGDGPLLILAGAGSGKTRVITHRLARLVERGVAPWRLLAVTFTNKAAGEMRERAAALLGAERARKLWIGTFHATCAKLLRLHADRAGLRPDFQIYDDADQKKLIAKVMAAEGVSDRAFTPRAMLARIDQAKNEGISEEEYAPDDYLSEIVARIYPAYQRRLREASAVDFGDLLLLALRLTDDAEVGPALRARFDHVLVDEFQDTNRVQYRLVQRLAATRNLCVVGDDDQAIYRWRGADVRNILDFEHDYPDAHVVKLEQNYRSTEVVLAAANGVIARNAHRKAKRLYTEQAGGEPIIYFTAGDERREAEFIARAVSQLVASEGRELGDFAVLYRMHAQSRALEEALRAHGLPYRVYGGLRFFDRAEVKDLLAWLRVLVHPGDEVSLERIVNVPPRGIGTSTMDKLLLDARMTRRSLWETMRAAVGLAPLSEANRAQEDHSGRTDAKRPGRQPDEPLWSHTGWQPPPPAPTSSTLLSTGPRKKLAAFVKLVASLRELASQAPPIGEPTIGEPASKPSISEPSIDELAAHVLDATGLLTALQLEGSPEARDRIGNLEELLNSMRDYRREAEQAGEPTSLASYLERVSLVAAADGEGGGVSLMTIHAAKGLEFPVVFLAGLEEGTFPLLGDEPSVEELEEERRLCYVALTRARERLVLTNASQRRLFRGERRVYTLTPALDDENPYTLRESRFVGDMPVECIARPVAVRSARAVARPGRTPEERDAVRVELDEGAPIPSPVRRQAEVARVEARRETPSEAHAETRIEYDIEPELAGGFRVGQRVRHEHFGEGRVRRLSGSGPGLRLVIEFGRVGEKTVVARFVQPA